MICAIMYLIFNDPTGIVPEDLQQHFRLLILGNFRVYGMAKFKPEFNPRYEEMVSHQRYQGKEGFFRLDFILDIGGDLLTVIVKGLVRS